MAKLRKNMISPVGKHNHGYVFHASGQNFKMTGNVVESFSNVSPEFNALVEAQSLFNITESGIEFYYDLIARRMVSKVDESSLANYDKTIELNDKLEFLKESRKSFNLKNKKEAVAQADSEISILESELTQVKSNGLAARFSYVAEDKSIRFNNSKILIGSLAEHVFAAGQIRYEDKPLFELFDLAAKNFESYKILDFISESTEGDLRVITIRADKNVYVCRVNESTRLVKFQKMLADAAIEYVLEQTGLDITYMVDDILESFRERKANRDANIKLRLEMVSFLKDQKAKLSEADTNLPEIKEANILLDGEIQRINHEISSFEKEELLTRAEGYVTATIDRDYDSIPAGTEIKVDALEYTGAAKEDLLTVFMGDEPLRIEKYRINLPSQESI